VIAARATGDTYGRWLLANRPGALDVLDSRMRGAPERVRPWRADARLETVRVG